MAENGIAITGVPAAIASSGGNPNPSYSDANTSSRPACTERAGDAAAPAPERSHPSGRPGLELWVQPAAGPRPISRQHEVRGSPPGASLEPGVCVEQIRQVLVRVVAGQTEEIAARQTQRDLAACSFSLPRASSLIFGRQRDHANLGLRDPEFRGDFPAHAFGVNDKFLHRGKHQPALARIVSKLASGANTRGMRYAMRSWICNYQTCG